MSIGIIFQHFWMDQTGDLEKQAHRNTEYLIENLNKNVATMAFDITVDPILQQIKDKFTSLVEFKENVAQSDLPKQKMKQWIIDKEIDEIYIAGLHFNCCVMQCTTALKEIAEELDLEWGNKFTVNVIEECTISLQENQADPCRLEDTTLYMDYELIKPWLVKTEKVLGRTK